MKKFIALLLSIVMGLSLFTGCGSKYVTLGEYKGVEVTVKKNAYTEAELNNFTLLAYRGEVTETNGAITDRPVKKGDTVIIDFEGKQDGVAFEGGTATGYELGIGSGSFIDGFEDGLIGVTPGETVDLNLTFPEEYHAEDLAGQSVVFTVTVHYIYPNAEDMNDAVVAAFGNESYSTVEELKQYSADYLEQYYESEYEANVQNAVIEAVMSRTLVDKLPEKRVNAYVDRLNKTYSSYAASYGLDVETFINYMMGKDAKTLAQEYVGNYLTMEAIAKKEGIKLTDEEIRERAETEAEAMGYSVDSYLSVVGEEDFKENLLMEKVVDFLVENAVIVTE